MTLHSIVDVPGRAQQLAEWVDKAKKLTAKNSKLYAWHLSYIAGAWAHEWGIKPSGNPFIGQNLQDLSSYWEAGYMASFIAKGGTPSSTNEKKKWLQDRKKEPPKEPETK